MSLGILNYIYPKPDPLKNRLALSLDVAIIASVVIISTLALLQIGNLAQAKTYICISGGVIASVVIISDILGCYKLKRNLKNVYREQLITMIQAAQADDNDKSYFRDLSIPCHRVLGSLWLGNFGGFIQTTDIEGVSVMYGSEVAQVENVNNPQQFKTIITANDISQSIKFYSSKKDIDLEQLKRYFQEKGIVWFNLATSDDRDWESLVSKCRSLNREVSENPFSRLFQEFDEAVFRGRTILVHCHSGQSLSASLIVAYMINRFGITVEQGFTYLKSVRACVKPTFTDQLSQK